MKRIYLRNIKKYAIVDDKDYDRLIKFHWYGVRYYNTWYARCWYLGRHNYIHRWILKSTQNIDHKNRNGLDNRRFNLRASTQSTNILNSRPFSTNTSGHRGVSYYKRDNNWAASIMIKGRTIHLGKFRSRNAASKARRDYEREHSCL